MRERARARSAGLVVRPLGDELVVYDTQAHRAHCLNRTAALVFLRADGLRTDAEIAALLGGGADKGLVANALAKLAAAQLLESDSERAQPPSRREVLRQVGLGAALLAPIVTSLLVPTPAEAAATCIPGTACTASNIGQPCYPTDPSQCPAQGFTCQGPGLCQI